MLEYPKRFLAWLMNRVRVNDVRPATCHGHPAFLKRRRSGASVILFFANIFLSLTRSGVAMFVRGSDWITWEISCVRLLYPSHPQPERGLGCSILLPRFPGTSLRQLAGGSRLDSAALAAAARELHRVHQLPSAQFSGPWSHGDLHLDNVIYDPASNTASLIDFDTRHLPSAAATWRHADDLNVFLLEFLGSAGDDWLSLATSFLQAYHGPSVLQELARQLTIPGGIAKILWYTRIYGSSVNKIEPRMRELRSILQQIANAS